MKTPKTALAATLQVTEVSREFFENEYRLRVGVSVELGEKTVTRLFHFPVDIEQEELEYELLKIKTSILQDEQSSLAAVQEKQESGKIEQMAENLMSKTF